MHKIKIFFLLSAMMIAQQAFADSANTESSMGSAESKPCATIAKTCLAAGFSRTEVAGKQFWHDCMKPVLLGQSVSGVTIAPADAQSCRAQKIQNMTKELQDLQNAAQKRALSQ